MSYIFFIFISIVKLIDLFDDDDRRLLESCTLCPRECRVNRFDGATGYCNVDADINIASICIHRGEEPVISGEKGICNIFFAGCNLRCSYCQNWEISRPCRDTINARMEISVVLDRIEEILSSGITAIGFVSPSHLVPQVKAIIRGLHFRGIKPITVYNTNSYDKVDTIRGLSDLIDVYLPDYKYVTPEISSKLSDTSDYGEVALRALKEMYFQKGSTLSTNASGVAERGMLIRHLVLPGHVDESIKVLRSVAEELSPGINLSLMSQYHPTPNVKYHSEMDRLLSRSEYRIVVKEMENLGFRNGWLQDIESNAIYMPDFRRENPFE